MQRIGYKASIDVLRLLTASQTAGGLVGTGRGAAGYSTHNRHDAPASLAGVAAAAAAAAAGIAAVTTAAADAPQGNTDSSRASRPWFSRMPSSSSSSSSGGGGSSSSTASPALGQQQQWSTASGEPLSGAIPLLTEDGLTNHPLDYTPITNEHTAAMTMAKQAGVEAYQAGRYSEAERRFQEALSEAKLGFPPGDPHIPSAMHCLAELYRNTGRYEQAQELYEQVAADLLEHLGDRHWMYTAALSSLAHCHEAKQQYDTAVALLEQALELRRQLFSDSSFLYADTASHLAVVLLKRDKAAAAAAGSSEATAVASSSSSGGGGWFGRGKRSIGSSCSSDGDVQRAIGLLQKAVHTVEEAGQVQDTPAAAWLVELAAAQTKLQQHAAAVDSLKKALEYMALRRNTQQEQQQQGPVEAGGESAAGSSDEAAAAAAAAETALQVQRLRIMAQGSEVAERLVDAQVSSGDLAGATQTMREAVDARTILHGRHLVVAKSMTRLSKLLLQSEPADPQSVQLAQHYAASAVAIAEHALQGAQRATLWSGLFNSLRFSSHKANAEATKASERLLAALQLGNACLALSAAENLSGHAAESEAALRKAVTQLRWVLGVGNEDVHRITQEKGLEPALLERVVGLLVDLKLLQMDCLEALAAALKQHAAAAQQVQLGSSKPAATVDPEESRVLLGEAELLAAELYAD